MVQAPLEAVALGLERVALLGGPFDSGEEPAGELAGLGDRAPDPVGEIIELDPPNLITYVWGGERLRFALEPVAGGCLLVFEHVFDDRALGAQHAAGWDRYLDRLAAHVAGEPLPAAGSGAEAELHERYAARFGLDPEVGRRTIAAMQSQEDSPSDVAAGQPEAVRSPGSSE